MINESHSAKLLREISNGELNPFHVIEAVQEHCGNLIHCHNHPDVQPSGVEYHHRAIVKYVQEILNIMGALHPELSLSSEGDIEALARIKPELETLAEWHDRRWQVFHGDEENDET